MTFYILTFKPMEKRFKTYFLILLLSCVGVLSLFVFATAFLDIFGLHGLRENDKVRVYGEERFSKYLMSFHYIPQHFDGMILGPSLSANLDPEPFPDGNYFNASIMGARMNTILSLATNVIANNGGIKKAIVCIHPYVTNDTGAAETDYMKPDTYWKAYGSRNLLRVYGLGLIRRFNIWPEKYPKNQYKTNGCNQFEGLFRVDDLAGRIEEEIGIINNSDFEIGASQRLAFEKLLTLLEQNDIQTFIYFHPVPFPIYQAHQDKLDEFWNEMLSTIQGQKERTFHAHNFNDPNFSGFSNDFTNYVDHGHLSKKGQKTLMGEIFKEWDSNGSGN